MMRIIFLILQLLFCFLAIGQKISFVSLTDLQLPNAGNANGTLYSRNDTIKKFFDYSGRPDILIVNSFSSDFSVNQFRDQVLNVNGIDHYKAEYNNYNLTTHPWLSALFYDSTKINFEGRLDIVPPEYFYSFVRYDLSATDSSGKTYPLKIFTNHLSSCYLDNPGCADVRLELAKEMDLVLGLDSLSNFIIAGPQLVLVSGREARVGCTRTYYSIQFPNFYETL
ncbi:hypothetical protein HZR84_14345 [Hyphobacterium sp. CCMP332]|nr:hypothetical protein HZR84_14345 [Hyphobacterium sp. CCMP332]